MDFTYTFKNMEYSESLVEHASVKIEKFTKYELPIGQIHFLFNLQHQTKAKVSVIISGTYFNYKVTVDDADMYCAVDKAAEKVARQLSKRKGRVRRRRQQQQHAQIAAWQQTEADIETEEDYDYKRVG